MALWEVPRSMPTEGGEGWVCGEKRWKRGRDEVEEKRQRQVSEEKNLPLLFSESTAFFGLSFMYETFHERTVSLGVFEEAEAATPRERRGETHCRRRIEV